MTSTSTKLPAVTLDVIELDFTDRTYQTLAINLTQPGDLIQPDLLPQLKLPSTLDLNREVILFGQAPIWLYCHLIERCRQAPWIACYNAPLGKIVVIRSQLPQPSVGDTVAPQFNTRPGVAILIGGPPDSGKSLLSKAIRDAIAKLHPTCRFFLHRANWDGQGNWAYESPDLALTAELVLGFDAKLHWHPEAAKLVPKYFQEQARAVENLRKVRDLILVDVGGVPQLEKHPLVDACSHYIIISRDPTAIASWHTLCASKLPCLAVLHSGSDNNSVSPCQSPFLELNLELKAIAETGVLPDLLLAAISQTLAVTGFPSREAIYFSPHRYS